MEELPKSYDSSQVEDAIYQQWLNSGYFNPDKLPDTHLKQQYSIVLPPPNVTGNLHVGHALMVVIQDALIRFERMRGKKTLWIPGTDHAAIATQSKVEKEIYKKEEKSRHDLGRTEFLKRVDEFAAASHDTITNQVKKMGASVDWSREAFTLDATRTRAVKTAFRRLHDLGLIYQGIRIINWDPKGQTTISDDEIIRETRPGKLYTFRYSKDFPIPISTTRPETKIGDSAVAVNPNDPRYAQFVGQEFDVEFADTKLHLTIVADEGVDMEFGTGALGVTPAHSSMDWDIAQKYNLPHKQIIDERGKMITDVSWLEGKKVAEARELVAEWITSHGLMEAVEDVEQNLALAERTNGVIEPLPKKQWFIDVNREFALPHSEIEGIQAGEIVTLKRLMRHVVETKQINILPDRYEKIYHHWIDNLRDWCISRQIWYGHQVPVWYDPEGNQHLPEEKTVYLARHAQCEDNSHNILARPESALTLLGGDQAKQLADNLRGQGIQTIIASPLLRSQQTAKIVAQELGLPETAIRTWEEIQEIHVGELIGTPEDPDLHGFAQAQKAGIGESLESIEGRIKTTVAKLEQLHTEGPILVVAHGGFNAVFQAHLEGRKKEDYVDYRTKLGAIQNASFKQLTLVQDPIGESLTQDTDTLDTWFSSGLWTFSTLGWPNQTQDLHDFHPTTVLETGYDILFFWVARMVLQTTTLTGQVPFRTVYLHGLVRDANKQKMSKSKGNIVDPLDMITKYGTDALRFALIFNTAPGTDIALAEDKIKGMKHFANKVWNIARFVMTNLEGTGNRVQGTESSHYTLTPIPTTDADKDILAKLNTVTADVTKSLENFQLHEAAQTLYQFVWHEFADVYVEASKTQLQDEKLKPTTLHILYYTLNTMLTLLHPFMPFVTEHITNLLIERGLKDTKLPLIVSKWPEA